MTPPSDCSHHNKHNKDDTVIPLPSSSATASARMPTAPGGGEIPAPHGSIGSGGGTQAGLTDPAGDGCKLGLDAAPILSYPSRVAAPTKQQTNGEGGAGREHEDEPSGPPKSRFTRRTDALLTYDDDDGDATYARAVPNTKYHHKPQPRHTVPHLSSTHPVSVQEEGTPSPCLHHRATTPAD